MSVREGYKQTEIGVIPEEWEAKAFGNILTVKYGKNQKQVEDSNGLYPILGTGGLMGYANKFLYDKPSVLIGRKGTIDKPQYMDTPFWTVDTLFYTEINADIDPKWLFQKFKTIDWKKHNEASGVPSLSVSNIQRIVVSVPPLTEQQKIAEILSTVDQKIDSIGTKIEETQTLKWGLMQRLLSEGIGHSEFKESEIGRIPTGWEVVKVGSICNLTAGGTPSTSKDSYWNPKEIPWLSSGEVNKKIIHYTNNMISREGLDNSSAKLIPKHSILIALAGQGKTRGTVAITEIELSTNQSVATILPSKKIDSYYLYHNLNSRYEELRNMSTGSGGRGGLNLAILKSVIIALPPLQEQKEIAAIFSITDEKLETLRVKKEAFETLKKGLMQKLLSGEVRAK